MLKLGFEVDSVYAAYTRLRRVVDSLSLQCSIFFGVGADLDGPLTQPGYPELSDLRHGET